jgi:hypothetical protein
MPHASTNLWDRLGDLLPWQGSVERWEERNFPHLAPYVSDSILFATIFGGAGAAVVAFQRVPLDSV